MRTGFTLIELLVVITIIVVLLALLTPALDKAIYQAELAACAANTRGLAQAALVYAAANKRRYPHRTQFDPGDSQEPALVKNSQGDDRPMMNDYMGVQLYNDPLTEKVDFGEANHPQTNIFAGSDLWYGFQYHLSTGDEPGMYRLGNRFGWSGPDQEGNQKSWRFAILAGDSDQISLASGTLPGAGVLSSHPDSNGVLNSVAQQDNVNGPPVPGPTGQRRTRSNWVTSGTIYRGALDLNHAYDDGSVNRTDDVIVPANSDGIWTDERMVPVGLWNNGSETGPMGQGGAIGPMWNHIPVK